MFRQDKLKLKKRKNAALKVLLLSVFVTFICTSMLVGTTYAWLTDSVTSGRNTIVSGSLDVELLYYNDVGNWVTADNNIFADVAWEPGRIYYRAVQIKNNGDMPIKYAFRANIPAEYGSINTQGNQFYLSDAMKVLQEVYTTPEAAVAAMQGVGSRVDQVTDLGFGGFSELKSTTAAEEIAGGASKYVLLTINMPEREVENLTTKDGMPLPKFDVQLVVMAVKGTSQDGFGNTAEDTANTLTATVDWVKYPLDTDTLLYTKTENNNTIYMIENKDDFDRFVAAVNKNVSFTDKTVRLMADIDLDGAAWPFTSAFAGTFDGNGKTIRNFSLSVTDSGTVKLLGNNASNVTIQGLTVNAGFTATVDNTATVTVTENI